MGSRRKICAIARALLCVSAALTLSACSVDTAVDFSEKLTFAMLGTYESTEGATGNSDPRFIKVSFVGASLTKQDGTKVELYEGDPQVFRIINRPQILHEVDMSAYVGETISALTLTFDSSITAGGRVEEAMASSLLSPTVSYQQAYVVEKAIQKRLEVQLLWKNIVTLDESVSPHSETLGLPGMAVEFQNE